MTKSEIRKTHLAAQKSFTTDERNEKSEQIASNFFQKFDLSKINCLHCFIAIEKFGEIDTALIYKRIWRDFPHIRTLVPRVNFETGELENVRFTANSLLKENIWQIREPIDGEVIAAKNIDLVLVPLSGFDEKGFRAGYGKGFYDKFLINCRADCLKIGLNYFAPIEEIADIQNFDVKLDFCVTPEKVWEFAHTAIGAAID